MVSMVDAHGDPDAGGYRKEDPDVNRENTEKRSNGLLRSAIPIEPVKPQAPGEAGVISDDLQQMAKVSLWLLETNGHARRTAEEARKPSPVVARQAGNF